MKKSSLSVWLRLVLAAGGGAWLLNTGRPAPRRPPTFVLLDGSKKTTDADLKGKVTLVNFWATSCVTCVAEMPQMVATYDKYKAQGLRHLWRSP